MEHFTGRELIHEWNKEKKDYRLPVVLPQIAQILDETWRDGLQSTTAVDPGTAGKIAGIRLMCKLGINAVNIGFAAAASRIYDDAYAMAKVIRDERLPITPYCLARTMIEDIEKIVQLKEKLGFVIHAFLFVGASPIRHFVENWDVKTVVERTRKAVSYAVANGLPAMFFTEDTTRSHPDMLKALWETAIEAGATRLGIADTVGYANPQGATQIVKFCRQVIAESGKQVEIDWHGHNDRGLGVMNSLAAVDAGAHRIHACALGIGERVGNTSMEQLLVNLKLDEYPGYADRDLTDLRAYVTLVSQACQVPVPPDYPVVGANAFRTSTGIHAAAVIKAAAMGGHWLADRIYSSVPAEEIGLGQSIEVGPQSGKSNVQHWLLRHGHADLAHNESVVHHILEAVKKEARVLKEEEIAALIASFQNCKKNFAAAG